jgi:hypothetical protein
VARPPQQLYQLEPASTSTISVATLMMPATAPSGSQLLLPPGGTAVAAQVPPTQNGVHFAPLKEAAHSAGVEPSAPLHTQAASLQMLLRGQM